MLLHRLPKDHKILYGTTPFSISPCQSSCPAISMPGQPHTAGVCALLVLMYLPWVATIEVKSSFAQFADVSVHYKHTSSSYADVPVVLLLHESGQDSSIWQQTGTLAALQAANATAVTMDLPGTGNSTSLAFDSPVMRAEVLRAVFDRFEEATHRILVSPGDSGRYATAYLEHYGHQLQGWVPVSLQGASTWQGPGVMGGHLMVHMLAMYGKEDPALPDIHTLWAMFFHAQMIAIPKAGPRCYQDNPASFNHHLTKFVQELVDPPKKQQTQH